MVKWSKTIHDRVSTATVAIPYLGTSPIYPVFAIKAMLLKRPTQTDEPLFQVSSAGHSKVLTDSVARKHLKQISSILQLPRSLTFHDFRRGGGDLGIPKGRSCTTNSGTGYLVIFLCLKIHQLASFGCLAGVKDIPSPPFSLATHTGHLGSPSSLQLYIQSSVIIITGTYYLQFYILFY